MAKTKKQNARDAALAWLRIQGDKAFENQNKKEVEVITYLIKEIVKPDYKEIIDKMHCIVRKDGYLNITTFCNLLPNAKPKTINQKANK